jgi:Holliday junction resolvase RusA-like endonuclease
LIDKAFIAFKIHGQATAFARAGAMGKRRFTPQKQAAHMYVIQQTAIAKMQLDGASIIEGPVQAIIRVSYPYPSSWSNRKKADTKWKVSRPDCDNLAKIILDALNGIVWVDDAQVVELNVQKQYGLNAETLVTIQEL